MVYLCFRRVLAWHDEDAVAAALEPSMRPKVELWNATFDMRYAAFRVRLCEIAGRSLGRVEGATLAPLADVPRGALVVPLDDDDWLAPQLAQRLLAVQLPGIEGYHWDRYILEAPRRARRWPWAATRRAADTSRYTCGTNNYAVVHLPELAPSIASHVTASAQFDANPGRVRYVAGSSSVQNRNLASRSGLGGRSRALTRADLLARFRRHKKLYARLRLPPEVAWAQPYAAAMAELMQAVRLK